MILIGSAALLSVTVGHRPAVSLRLCTDERGPDCRVALGHFEDHLRATQSP
jgi:hypothetical protein